MLGYIVPDKPELKVREFELYSGYYCGICKSIERRYGQIPRMTLNYDSVFLALVIASLDPKRERFEMERCPVHPLKRRLIVYDEAGIDYAADIMLLLAYFKLLDDLQDEGGAKAKAGAVLLKKTYKKLMKTHGEKCIMIESKLKELYQMEQEKCPSLDHAAEPFAKLMEEVFDPGTSGGGNEAALLRRMGYHIGKWIYLIDAFDDLEENLKNGAYNPLLYQFEHDPDRESPREFRSRIRDRIEYNLLFYLSELALAWEQLNKEKNRGIIDNIVYFGLLRKTEQILSKGNTDDAKSI